MIALCLVLYFLIVVTIDSFMISSPMIRIASLKMADVEVSLQISETSQLRISKLTQFVIIFNNICLLTV